jgi:Ca2+-binding EF-hand superfamily protein
VSASSDVNQDGVLSSSELNSLIRSFLQALSTDCQALVVEHLKQSIEKVHFSFFFAISFENFPSFGFLLFIYLEIIGAF